MFTKVTADYFIHWKPMDKEQPLDKEQQKLPSDMYLYLSVEANSLLTRLRKSEILTFRIPIPDHHWHPHS